MKPIGLFTADIHLSHKPPKARACEHNWYRCMKRYLGELKEIVDYWSEQANQPVPLFYAGDIFDHWDAPAQLINFAIENLPKGYAIPGQHDLPYHNDKLLFKSAYWTLVKAGTLYEVPSDGRLFPKMFVSGFGWKKPILRGLDDPGGIKVALLHKYLWSVPETGHGKAAEKDNVSNLPVEALSYDFIFSGDNHIPFTAVCSNTTVVNCGSFMARNTSQRGYEPAVHVLYDNRDLDTAIIRTARKDRWIDKEEKKQEPKINPKLGKLIKKFSKLSADHVDFYSQIRIALEDESVNEEVKQIVLKGLDAIKRRK